MAEPMHDTLAEAAVIGAVLQDADQLLHAQSLKPEEFHEPRNRLAWAAILRLYGDGKAIDHLTVAEALAATGDLAAAGGPARLMELDQGVPLACNVPEYVASVRDRAVRRALVARAQAAAASAMDMSRPATTGALEASADFASLGAAGARELQTMQDAMGEMLDDLQAIAEGRALAAVRTGIDVWDKLIGGLPMGKLTLIGAYPSVGKTALMVRMFANIAQAGVPVGVFSLEDPKAALLRRIVSRESTVPVRRLATEPLPPYLQDAVGAAAQRVWPWLANIIVEDRSGMKASQVAAVARQMVVQRGCKVIFVDHAGELHLDAGHDRHDLALSAAIRGLRDVAKDLNVSVVLLAHFHRPKSGTDKEPRHMRPTSGLWKNSGGFEEAARVAGGLWIDPQMPDGIVCTILKQTEGQKDIDFWMPLHKASGLIESTGGIACEGDTGFDADPRGGGR